MNPVHIEAGPIENSWKLYDIRGNHFFVCAEWNAAGNELHVSIRYSNDNDKRLPEWVTLHVESLPAINSGASIDSARPGSREEGRGTKVTMWNHRAEDGVIGWAFDYGPMGDCNKTWDAFIKFEGCADLVGISLSCVLRSKWYKLGKKERRVLHDWAAVHIPFKKRITVR